MTKVLYIKSKNAYICTYFATNPVTGAKENAYEIECDVEGLAKFASRFITSAPSQSAENSAMIISIWN